MTKAAKKQRSVTFYIPEELQKRLKKESEDTDMSASHIARRVFKEYFKGKDSK